MTEKEENSDKLRRGQEVEDDTFGFRLMTVKDLGTNWFKEECKDDELVLLIRNWTIRGFERSVDVLRTLPFCVGKLPAVSGIWFEGGDIVASALGELKGVKEVRFGVGSDLRIVPGFLSSLSHDLNRLTICNMPETTFSDSAGVLPSLTNLKELDLSDCGLKQLPANFSHLTQLTKLDLRLNKELERLPEDIGSKMKKMKKLNLTRCGLKELPANLGDLTDLEILFLGNCFLTKLPSSFVNLKKVSNFNCDGNPLVMPPINVCNQGLHAVQAYFSFLQKLALKFKIILLGEACSGKTSLIQTIRNKKSTCTHEVDRTIGVKECELTLSGGKKAKALDCGGQKCYLRTNQLVVGENAMIIIVVDINKYQPTKDSFHQHIGQYLQVVYERCRRVQILLVFTKVDCIPGQFSRWVKSPFGDSLPPEFFPYQSEVDHQLRAFLENRRKDWTRIEKTCCSAETLTFINSQIRIHSELIFVSAKDLATAKTLEKLIDDLSKDQSIFPTVNDVVPAAWLDFEQELVKKSAAADSELSILEMPRVTALGTLHSLTEDHVKIVISYFHEVGTLLYFPHPRLSNVVFGSSKRIVDVLKEIFCHNHSKRQYHKGFAEVYKSQRQFDIDKQKLVDNGIITIPLFKALLSNLNLSTKSLNVVVNLLLSFDFAYVKAGSSRCSDVSANELKLDPENVLHHLEEENASFLLPWFLIEKCPASVSEDFPEVCPSLWTEVKISFSFGLSLPLGIFERFSARCHHHSELIRHWDSGFMLKYGPVMAKFICELGGHDPGIHCICRVPKSMNALVRLFHVLWRCVMDLDRLLRTIPGCLYETFLDFHDDEKLLQKEKFRISKQWRLEAVDGVVADSTLKECSQAVEKVVVSAVKRKQSLNDVYSDVLGRLVVSSSVYFKKVALNVGSRYCNELAISLCMGHEGWEGSAVTLLGKWQGKQGKGAVVAVLCDALQECGLNEVRKKCFHDIHDIEQLQQLTMAASGSKWESRLTDVFTEAVPLVANLLSGSLLDRLFSKRLLTSALYDDVRRARSRDGDINAARDLLQLLKRGPPSSFDEFCNVLLEVDGGQDLYDCLTANSE